MKPSQGIPATVLLIICLVSSQGDNPYNPGQYGVDSLDFSPQKDDIPLHTKVFFPKSTGKFTPIVFIGGLYGWVVSESYSTLLSNLASHGYIAVGMDRFYLDQTDLSSPDFKPRKISGLEGESQALQLYFNTTQWIKTHLKRQIVATADWNKTSLLCHSAGCDDTLVMVNLSRTIAQASVFLDPMSVNAMILQPIESKLKVLAYMSQLSEEKPMCCIPGTDYKKIYDLVNCTKVRVQVKDFGHCDILDDLLWEACHIAHACRTTDNKKLGIYRNFTTGVIDGFLQWTLHGNVDMQKYVTNQAYMPLPLVDLAFDLTC